MSDQDELDYLRDQLAIHRANLYTLEKQRGTFGAAYVPAHIVLQIKQIRSELAQVKQALRDAGEHVEDQLIDGERGRASSSNASKPAPAKPTPAQPAPQTATTMTGPVTINNFNGAIQNSILNISSQLDNVSQSISTIPKVTTAHKDELVSLTEELKKQLLQLSSKGQQADAEQVSKRVTNTIAELQEEEPSQHYIEKQLESIKTMAAKHEEIKPTSDDFLDKVLEVLKSKDTA